MPKYEIVVTIFSPVNQVVLVEAEDANEAMNFVHTTLKEHNIQHFPFLQCNEVTVN